MITRIAIENFKGIGDRIEVPIRPITLLFGPNSAGKSSIMHAIHYAREVLERHNVDADRTLAGGDCLNLGGFREMVHRHEIDRRIGLRFDLDLGPVRFHEQFPVDEYLVANLDCSDAGLEVMNAWVELSIGCVDPATDRKPQVLSYEVGLDGIAFARVDCTRTATMRDRGDNSSYRGGGVLAWLNFWHPSITWPEPHGSVNDSAGPLDKLYPQLRPYLERLYYSDIDYGSLTSEEDEEWLSHRADDGELIVLGFDHPDVFVEDTIRSIAIDAEGSFFETWIGKRTDTGRLAVQSVEFRKRLGWDDRKAQAYYAKLCRDIAEDATHITAIPAQDDALPAFDSELKLELPDAVNDDVDAGDLLGAGRFLDQVLTRLIVGPGRLLRDMLARFRYVGPIRQIPSSDHTPPHYPDLSRWASGLAAWDMLANPHDASLVDKVSDWLWNENRLNTGYQLVTKRIKEIDAYLQERMLRVEWEEGAPSDLVKDILGELELLPEKQRFFIRDAERGVDLAPCSVGLGISQVVPVIVSVLADDDAVVQIEQPELHLHPTQQAAIGDLLVVGGLTGCRKVLLIETHSEHLILRILRRIRQTHRETPFNNIEIRPEHVMTLYIEPLNGQTTAFEIAIGDDGEFLQPWPDKFFDQDYEERYG